MKIRKKNLKTFKIDFNKLILYKSYLRKKNLSY